MADEDFRRFIYTDTTGHRTIGWGWNLEEGITALEARTILALQLHQIRIRLQHVYSPYGDQEACVRDALTESAYVLGVHGLLRFRKALGALARRDRAEAAAQIKASQWRSEAPERVDRIAATIATCDGA